MINLEWTHFAFLFFGLAGYFAFVRLHFRIKYLEMDKQIEENKSKYRGYKGD